MATASGNPSFSAPWPSSARRVKRESTVIVEQGEDGYLIGTVPPVRDELMENIQEVRAPCLEELGEGAREPLEFLGVRAAVSFPFHPFARAF